MEQTETICVELIYITANKQNIIKLVLPLDSSIETAINKSGLLTRYPEIDLAVNKVGVFNKIQALDYQLKDGDRVDIYRPLQADPKEARRRRANKK